MSEPRVISTIKAPAAIGPYAQAIRAGEFVYCSGQIALEPATGALLDGDVSAQTRQVLANLREVLEAAGTSLHRAVKCTVYLADMNDFPAVNEVYGEVFGESTPARATVEVSRLPKDARVEIDVIALV